MDGDILEGDNYIDVSNFSYEGWLKFVFDHPARRGGKQWHFHLDKEMLLVKPSVWIEHSLRLFHNFIPVTLEYSLNQIDQGIGFLLGHSLMEPEFNECLMAGRAYQTY
jgi:hypothetical protein